MALLPLCGKMLIHSKLNSQYGRCNAILISFVTTNFWYVNYYQVLLNTKDFPVIKFSNAKTGKGESRNFRISNLVQILISLQKCFSFFKQLFYSWTFAIWELTFLLITNAKFRMCLMICLALKISVTKHRQDISQSLIQN